jgi:hypothetical protein
MAGEKSQSLDNGDNTRISWPPGHYFVSPTYGTMNELGADGWQVGGLFWELFGKERVSRILRAVFFRHLKIGLEDVRAYVVTIPDTAHDALDYYKDQGCETAEYVAAKHVRFH